MTYLASVLVATLSNGGTSAAYALRVQEPGEAAVLKQMRFPVGLTSPQYAAMNDAMFFVKVDAGFSFYTAAIVPLANALVANPSSTDLITVPTFVGGALVAQGSQIVTVLRDDLAVLYNNGVGYSGPTEFRLRLITIEGGEPVSELVVPITTGLPGWVSSGAMVRCSVEAVSGGFVLVDVMCTSANVHLTVDTATGDVDVLGAVAFSGVGVAGAFLAPLYGFDTAGDQFITALSSSALFSISTVAGETGGIYVGSPVSLPNTVEYTTSAPVSDAGYGYRIPTTAGATVTSASLIALATTAFTAAFGVAPTSVSTAEHLTANVSGTLVPPITPPFWTNFRNSHETLDT